MDKKAIKKYVKQSKEVIRGDHKGFAFREGETLTDFQKALYFVIAVQESPKLDMATAIHLYSEYGCKKKTQDGKPAKEKYFCDELNRCGIYGGYKYVALEGEELRKRVVGHLMNNLGALIVKGYIDVIPKMSLNEVKERHTKKLQS